MARTRSSTKNNSAANLGFEARLWLAVSEVRKQHDEGRLVLIGLLPSSLLLHTFSVLAPFADSVSERFNEWLMDKAKAGTVFLQEQLAWLNLMRDQIPTSLSIEPDDLDLSPFNQRGGLGKSASALRRRTATASR